MQDGRPNPQRACQTDTTQKATTMTSADDFFSSNSKGASFPTIGASVAGTITRIGDEINQTIPGSGEPVYYQRGPRKGQIKKQLPITVQTDERDPAVDNDDGQRTIYFKGNMKGSFMKELRNVGAPGPRVGGYLKVTYVKDIPGEGAFPAKDYEVRYAPPQPQQGGNADQFFQAPPAQQPVAAAAGGWQNGNPSGRPF